MLFILLGKHMSNILNRMGDGHSVKEELDLIVLHEEPLIEITRDKKQIWVEDKLLWEADD